MPGLKVVTPITPYDVKGMFKAAVRDDNPVIFFEHKRSYQLKGEVPDGVDYTVPFGKAAIRREGTDVTIVAYSMMAMKAIAAAEELEKEGISCEVIDLRSILPMDYDTVMASIAKTNRVVVVQEASIRGGLAGDIIAEIIERGFGPAGRSAHTGGRPQRADALQQVSGRSGDPERKYHQGRGIQSPEKRLSKGRVTWQRS